MWTLLAFISALCLGCYDISKKVALRENRVIDVLTISICMSACMLAIPLVLSQLCPEGMSATHFYVPRMSPEAHLYTLLKSVIVLSSWVFAYISLKHLPLSVVSPMQATRPMWTLIGALLIFHEHLNTYQWIGVLLAIGTIVIFSFESNRKNRNIRNNLNHDKRYYICLALAILIGACSGLYDKYLMRRYDHNAVQVYYTFYQAAMMLTVWIISRIKSERVRELESERVRELESERVRELESERVRELESERRKVKGLLPILLISVFLVISDNVYMLALRDPDSMIAVVSTIRRGGAVIGFAYGLIFLKEHDPWRKVACMIGILTGLIFLALGAL